MVMIFIDYLHSRDGWGGGNQRVGSYSMQTHTLLSGITSVVVSPLQNNWTPTLWASPNKSNSLPQHPIPHHVASTSIQSLHLTGREPPHDQYSD